MKHEPKKNGQGGHNNMDAEQLHKAYSSWLFRHYKSRPQDQEIVPFLNDDIKGFTEGQSWLKKARNAFQLSTSTVAEKLEISRSAYAKLEKSELEGTITLKALSKAAQAIDCELVYAVRPKKKVRFSWLIWQ